MFRLFFPFFVLLSRLSGVSCVSVSELLATINLGVPTLPITASSSSFGTQVSFSGNQYANGTHLGIWQASSCNAARLSYSSAKASWESAQAPTTCTMITTSYNFTAVTSRGPVNLSTLCDGHPRVPDTSDPTLTVVITTTGPFESCSSAHVTGNPGATYTGREPNCTIAESDCEQLYSTYVATGAGLIKPQCSTKLGFYPGCEQCTIYANGVQLIYWPVTTVSGDVCLGNGSTMTATPTGSGPNTLVTSGYTFTSPSAVGAFPRVD